jgi:hypothetical protein
MPRPFVCGARVVAKVNAGENRFMPIPIAFRFGKDQFANCAINALGGRQGIPPSSSRPGSPKSETIPTSGSCPATLPQARIDRALY